MHKYGLIGKTLTHSFSQQFFTALFVEKQVDALYANYELQTIEEIVEIFADLNLCGLNITIPYKQQIIPFLDELSPEATVIGAVNVVQFKNGKKIGHNTDAFGFHQSIKPFLTNVHERALILGTGGASQAVTYVFKSIGLDVIYCSRNPQKNKEYPYGEINEHMLKACKVIVNCTPVGTFPDVEASIPFPFEFLTPDHLVIDLIYNPEQTRFLRESEKRGSTVLNGLSMLKEQAIRAWQIWTED